MAVPDEATRSLRGLRAEWCAEGVNRESSLAGPEGLGGPPEQALQGPDLLQAPDPSPQPTRYRFDCFTVARAPRNPRARPPGSPRFLFARPGDICPRFPGGRGLKSSFEHVRRDCESGPVGPRVRSDKGPAAPKDVARKAPGTFPSSGKHVEHARGTPLVPYPGVELRANTQSTFGKCSLIQVAF